MRLWHQALIHYLPRQQLLGQHRECCALRGKGWGKKHSVVDYVFKYDLAHLYQYHLKVMKEMLARGYNVNTNWYDRRWRGNTLKLISPLLEVGTFVNYNNTAIYPEHNDNYLKECLDNLEAKGVDLVNGETIAHMKLLMIIKSV